MGIFLVFPSFYLISLYLPASSALAELATHSRPASPKPHPLKALCVLFSDPFPDSISETHHLQIQPCLPYVSTKLGRLSLSRKWVLK